MVSVVPTEYSPGGVGERKEEEMTKKSYFEVSPVASRWLWAGLAMVMVCKLLTLWGDTFALSGGSVAGSLGSGLTLLMQSGVVRALVSVLNGTGWVLLLEHFRRGMRHSGSRFWVAVALWEVLVAVAAVVAAIPTGGGVYAYAHTPGAWDEFRQTFLVNEQMVSGCVQLLVLCVCCVRYRGRLRCFGLLGMVCPVLAAMVEAQLYQWGTTGEAPVQGYLLLGYVARLLLFWVVAVALRRTMSTRIDVQPASADGDVAS